MRSVQIRQTIVLLISLIAIVGAALLVIVWAGGDDGDEAETAAPTVTAADTTADDTASDAGSAATGDTAADATAGDAAAATTDTTAEATATSSTSTTTTTIPLNCVVDSSAATSSTSSTAPLGSPTLKNSSKLTTAGLGAVTFGATLAEAEKAAGTKMIACSAVAACYRVTPASAPDGISFVVQDGRIERVDIARGPVTTRSGVGIGTTEARIIELFGDKIERSTIDDSRVDLVFVPVDDDDKNYRVIFTIHDGKVENLRAGRTAITTDRTPCS